MVPNEKEFDLGESILKDSLNMKRNEGGVEGRISSRVELKGKIVKILLLDEEGGKNFVKRSSLIFLLGFRCKRDFVPSNGDMNEL